MNCDLAMEGPTAWRIIKETGDGEKIKTDPGDKPKWKDKAQT